MHANANAMHEMRRDHGETDVRVSREVRPGNPRPMHRNTLVLPSQFALLSNERFALPRHAVCGIKQQNGPGIQCW